jgi:GT2 family glycosyltransferase
MKVSVIMSFTDRLKNLKNALSSWSKVTYPNCEFILIDDGSKNIDEAMSLVLDFKESTNQLVTFSRNENYVHVNKVWNKAAKETSGGEYVVFAMADEIVTPDILDKMVVYGDQRCSVNTLFLSEQMTNQLDSIDWKTNPHFIESLPGFWEYEDKGSINMNKHDASLLSHIIGWTRERWEWFGWFRNNDRGHLWLDQDIVIRSRVLGIKSETVEGISCYHQFHESYMTPGWTAPGYHPINERQARLLEESERDES